MEPASAKLALVVGLGNPGERYAETRHNAGFWYVQALAARLGVRFARESRFQGWLASTLTGGDKLRLLMPDTYMNHSGRSVQAVARYFSIEAADILVVHDELDLTPGIARLKRGGGHGGHNGLRDLISALGSRDFWRLRIGIGHPRDGEKVGDDVTDYVLRRAPKVDQRDIDQAIDRAIGETDLILRGELEKAMHVLHSAPRAAESD